MALLISFLSSSCCFLLDLRTAHAQLKGITSFLCSCYKSYQCTLRSKCVPANAKGIQVGRSASPTMATYLKKTAVWRATERLFHAECFIGFFSGRWELRNVQLWIKRRAHQCPFLHSQPSNRSGGGVVKIPHLLVLWLNKNRQVIIAWTTIVLIWKIMRNIIIRNISFAKDFFQLAKNALLDTWPKGQLGC